MDSGTCAFFIYVSIYIFAYIYVCLDVYVPHISQISGNESMRALHLCHIIAISSSHIYNAILMCICSLSPNAYHDYWILMLHL